MNKTLVLREREGYHERRRVWIGHKQGNTGDIIVLSDGVYVRGKQGKNGQPGGLMKLSPERELAVRRVLNQTPEELSEKIKGGQV